MCLHLSSCKPACVPACGCCPVHMLTDLAPRCQRAVPRTAAWTTGATRGDLNARPLQVPGRLEVACAPPSATGPVPYPCLPPDQTAHSRPRWLPAAVPDLLCCAQTLSLVDCGSVNDTGLQALARVASLQVGPLHARTQRRAFVTPRCMSYAGMPHLSCISSLPPGGPPARSRTLRCNSHAMPHIRPSHAPCHAIWCWCCAWLVGLIAEGLQHDYMHAPFGRCAAEPGSACRARGHANGGPFGLSVYVRGLFPIAAARVRPWTWAAASRCRTRAPSGWRRCRA